MSGLRFNRRSLIAMPLLVGAAGKTVLAEATPVPDERPAPIDLGSGIVIADIRKIPNTEPARYLVELQSHRDDAVDSPTIGVVLPDVPDDQSFSWAIPWHPVLQPGGSTFAIGLLPSPATDMSDGEWVLCKSEIGPGEHTNVLSRWEWELETETSLVDENTIHVNMVITNTGQTPLSTGEIYGLARDSSGRICGGFPNTNMYNLGLSDVKSVPRGITLQRNWSHPANAFNLCEDVNDMSVSVEVQPRFQSVAPGCPVVMPWNRDD